MKQDKIQQIIEDYDKLYVHTIKVIGKLKKLDSDMYDTKKYINNIIFDEKEVSVECDDSYHNDTYTHYIYFPISFLSMSDEELKQAVLIEKQRREEEKRLKKEKRELEQKQKKEEQERLQYERLKKKYGNQ